MAKTAVAFVVALLLTANTPVYRTLKGTHYHTNRACIALRTSGTVATITLNEATKAKLTLCGICARAKSK